jgi:hypothetical protein
LQGTLTSQVFRAARVTATRVQDAEGVPWGGLTKPTESGDLSPPSASFRLSGHLGA